MLCWCKRQQEIERLEHQVHVLAAMLTDFVWKFNDPEFSTIEGYMRASETLAKNLQK